MNLLRSPISRLRCSPYSCTAALLIATLIETLPPDTHLSDDEVLQRDADLDSGAAEEISHEELIRRV